MARPEVRDPWVRALRTVHLHMGAALLALLCSLVLLGWAWWGTRRGGDHAFAGGFGVLSTLLTALALSFYVSAAARVRARRVRGLWQVLGTTLVLLAGLVPLARRVPVLLAVVVVLAALEVWTLLDRVKGVRTARR